MALDVELLKKAKDEYDGKLSTFQSMKLYAMNGESDGRKNYIQNEERSNLKVKTNFIKKFIKEEVSYLLSNKPTYVSFSNDEKVIEFIRYKTAHWSKNHDKKLLREMLSFGNAYELYYTTQNELTKEYMFNSKIVNPLNGVAYFDDFGVMQYFLHIYSMRYEDKVLIDVYTPEAIHHCDENFEELTPATPHMFGEVPVSLAPISDYEELDTLYNDLKDLQDSYETNLSDCVNEVSDFRNSYLKFMGVKVDEELLADMKKMGIIQSNTPDAVIEFMTKNFNDSYIQNTLNTLEKMIYALSNHIDTNEKLQSNVSGSALKNRLIGLLSRVRDCEGCLQDVFSKRLYFMFKFFAIAEGANYDNRDIDVEFTLNVPSDDLLMAQTLSQLGIGTNISKKTGLEQLSFVSNGTKELEILKAEQESDIYNQGQGLLDGATGDGQE